MDQINSVLGKQLVSVRGIHVTVLVAILLAVLVWFLFLRSR